MKGKVLITGITGQDGSYLAELMLADGYEVHGMQRRTSTVTTERINHIMHNPENANKVETHYGDLADANSIVLLLNKIKPDMVINLGSMSHVKVSFDIPEYTAQVTGVAPLRILESLRALDMLHVRFYQASSSEMFGISPAPQNEETKMLPQSPYGCAKLYAYLITKAYRKGYGAWASNGILFNHESPRRGENFVTKKIVRAAVRIKMGKQKKVVLGNLKAMRDWGHAKDYMRAVKLIIEHDKPDDFVVASGEHFSVEYFAQRVFGAMSMHFEDYLETSADYFRPNEVPDLLGDSTKIRQVLGWKPEYTFDTLVQEMINETWNDEIKR